MSTVIWNAQDAAKATGGNASGAWEAGALSIDSRSIKPGELFIALKGEQTDGHRFVKSALERGASAAVVSDIPDGVDASKLLIVPDVQKALEDLAAFHRARLGAKFIGVTGSVGKTSTKEMLRIALAPHGAVFASYGNFNNHIGTPLNLASIPLNTQFAVCEMGMNHAGEIAQLTRLVRPDVSIITTVEAVHLEFFSGVEAIADAKAEIFLGMPAQGVAVLNADNGQFSRLTDAAKRAGVKHIRAFGSAAAHDFALLDCRPSLAGSEVTAQIAGKKISYTLGTIGRHWALTSLGVLGVADALGLDVGKTAYALSHVSELPGRGKLEPIVIAGGDATLLDDSYNASPAAMLAAFAKLRELKAAGVCKGRIIVALGDMRELGDSAQELHETLAGPLEQSGADAVFTAGPLMKHLHDALPAHLRAHHAPDAQALIPVVKAALHDNDLILVKGSHGSHMYALSAALLENNNPPSQERKRNAL